MLSNSIIYQDENVQQTTHSSAKTGVLGTTARRRALGDITNNGLKLQTHQGKAAAGASSSSSTSTTTKIGLKKVNQLSSNELVKPTIQPTHSTPMHETASETYGAGIEHQHQHQQKQQQQQQQQQLSRLYLDEDYSELEYCYGKDLFGIEGRPYDAGLKIESLRKAHAHATMVFTSEVHNALSSNWNEQLDYDYEFMGQPNHSLKSNNSNSSNSNRSSINSNIITETPVPTSTVQHAATTTTGAVMMTIPKSIIPISSSSSSSSPTQAQTSAPSSQASSSSSSKIVRTTTSTTTKAMNSNSIKPMGRILKPISIRTNHGGGISSSNTNTNITTTTTTVNRTAPSSSSSSVVLPETTTMTLTTLNSHNSSSSSCLDDFNIVLDLDDLDL